MSRLSRSQLLALLPLLLLTATSDVHALRVEPGAGFGVEYTDNALLSNNSNNVADDTVLIGYAGALIAEDSGPLSLSADAGLNRYNYTQDTSDDRSYFNLNGHMNLQLVKQRANLYINDYYNQGLVNTIDPNTPDNIQDRNIFTTGISMNQPLGSQDTISLVPELTRFYYELQTTDNTQYSTTLSWDHQVSPLTSFGMSANLRKVDYDEEPISDTDFTTLNMSFSRTGNNSELGVTAGNARVRRDNESTTGFSGDFDYRAQMTSSSRMRFHASTALTDSSQGRLNITQDPDAGDDRDIQVTTDVIRNRGARLTYLRNGSSVDTTVWLDMKELIYSGSDNDRRVKGIGLELSRSFTGLLSGDVYITTENTELLERVRQDDSMTIGGRLRYKHTRKLDSALSVKYRERTSTDSSGGFENWTVFYNMSWGFGSVSSSSSAGG